jgi:hypothetical protein
MVGTGEDWGLFGETDWWNVDPNPVSPKGPAP